MRLTRRGRAPAGPPWLLLYAVPVLAAELLLFFVNPLLGTTAHGTILVVAISHHAFARRAAGEAAVVALLPLTRLLSIVIPVPEADPSTSYLMVGTPMVLATVLVARRVDPRVLLMGLGRPKRAWAQPFVAALGVPVGWLMLRVGLSGPFTYADNPILYVVSMLLFVALFEELLFRGLIREAAARHSAILGLVVPTALYAIMYVGTGSLEAVAAVGAIGLVFTACAWWTGSLWGVIVAHGVGRLIVGFG